VEKVGVDVPNYSEWKRQRVKLGMLGRGGVNTRRRVWREGWNGGADLVVSLGGAEEARKRRKADGQ